MHAAEIEDLLDRIETRAENLFRSKQFMCAESVLLAVSKGLSHDISEETAIALAAPFSDGMGGSGCTCGALSGAVMSIGLCLGGGQTRGQREKSRRFSKELHARFTGKFRSACCRVLCKDVREDPRRHFNQCVAITGAAARMVARLILEQEQGLADHVDLSFLNARHSVIGGLLKRIVPN
ncbi:MAG: C_GCAxxG_C_C family protein [Desulfobacterales bacterium]|nr:C_GCAxxG_C_C family protein [Desulfobacterales bacterium]